MKRAALNTYTDADEGLGHHIYDLTYNQVRTIGKWSTSSSPVMHQHRSPIRSVRHDNLLVARTHPSEVQYRLLVHPHISQPMVETGMCDLRRLLNLIYRTTRISGGFRVHADSCYLGS